MAKQVLMGKVTKYAAKNRTREIRVLAEKTVLLHPKYIKRNKTGEVSAVVVSPKEEIPNSCPVRIPLGYLSMNKETRQYIASL